jgi:hypothetical protein
MHRSMNKINILPVTADCNWNCHLNQIVTISLHYLQLLAFIYLAETGGDSLKFQGEGAPSLEGYRTFWSYLFVVKAPAR